MSVIYVKEQGSYIRKSGEKIEIIKQNQRLLSFPVWNIDGVSIIGNVQISTQALIYLMENGIDVSIFLIPVITLGRPELIPLKIYFCDLLSMMLIRI